MKKLLFAFSALLASSFLLTGCFFEAKEIPREESTDSVMTSEMPESDSTEQITEAATAAPTEQETAPETEDGTAAEEVSETETFAEMSEDTYVEYHFRSKKQLDQHFTKHGSEFEGDFDYKTAEDYEKGASDVINDPQSLYKTEAEDGDGVYYIEASNEFVILSTDGYIRTYFRPSAGKKYFDKQ